MSREKRHRTHKPKSQWPVCKCGRAQEYLVGGICAICRDPSLYEECQRIARADAKYQNVNGTKRGKARLARYESRVLREYERRTAKMPTPDVVSLLAERMPSDNGKRGGGPSGRDG